MPTSPSIACTRLAAALAVVLLSACSPSSSDPSRAGGSQNEVPVAATDPGSAGLPHMVRPVIVEPPRPADHGVYADDPVASPEDAAGRPGREAALRYMARDGGEDDATARNAPVSAQARPAEPARPVSKPAVRGRNVATQTADTMSRSPLPNPASSRDAAEPTSDVVPASGTAEPRTGRRIAAALREEPARAAVPREADVPMRPAPPPGATPRDPGQARSLNRQAIALINTGRPQQAIPLLEQALDLQPRDPEMLGNLGYACMLAGEHVRARAHLLTALELSPTRSATWLNLGQTYAELGQRDVAVDAVLKGYRYSTRKPSVRAALQRAARGDRHSAAWRAAAGSALAQIGDDGRS